MRRNAPLRAVLRAALRSHRALSAGTILAIAGAVGFALLPPLILETIVDQLTAAETVSLALAAGYFAALAMGALLQSAQNAAITVLGQAITAQMRQTMLQKLRHLEADYFSRNDAGAITSRFVGDVDTVETLFTDGVVSLFANACQVIGILVVVYTKSLGLGLLLTAALPVIFLLTRHFQKRMRRAQLSNRAAMAQLNSYLPETLRLRRLIRTFSLRRYMEKRYDRALQQSYQSMEKSNLYDSVYSPIVIGISTALTAALMLCAATGGTMQRFFGMTVGAAVASIAYIGKVFSPLESIGMEIQNIQSAVAGLARITEFLSLPEREMPRGAAPEGGAIVLSEVTFGYEAEKPVLQKCSFTVPDRQIATLLGRTGCGKSTVFRLLLGLYRPQAGRVTIGGADAFSLADSEKRKLFGYVPQEFAAVKGTVGQQISLFDPALSPEQIRHAARLVGLDGILAALPHGYDTPMDALTLSHGQYQLLSIARAIVTNPPILLLDEITAGLDSDTETRVLAALTEVSRGRTVLSISHRLGAASGTRIEL